MNPTPKRLLWVDDEIEFLRAHLLFLEEHGYEVETATNGDDGLVLLKQKPFDLVLLDEQMPGKDGLSTLEEIRASDNNIPVVMVTKSEEERLMEAALGRNISGYLIKPVNPSQILSVCKGILHSRTIRSSHVTSAYVREYAELKAGLLATPSPSKWEKIYFQLSKWDFELQSLPDAGLRETHQANRRELAKKFLGYVEENYVEWVGRKGGNPDLHTQTLKRKVFPVLKRGESCALVVMAGFRLDQWMALQKSLEPFFRVENGMAWSLLPSENIFCRSALFSGRLPREVSLDQPELWRRLQEDEDKAPCEREMLRFNLRKADLENVDPRVVHIRTHDDGARLLAELEKGDESQLLSLVVEFPEMLQAQRLADGGILRELAPDEKGMRDLTASWFRSSKLFEILQWCAAHRRTVVLTSDHGTVRVDAPAEIFCQDEKTPHPRLKTGLNISCDERHALFVEAPAQYGLPGESGQLAYAIAKDNHYFVYPNKFQYFVTQFREQMVSGGLSMEEMLVPLATLIPK
jgi:CheY-like chemotaxis protein